MIARIKKSRPARFCKRLFFPRRPNNAYATHVPILIGLASMCEIKSVLEFGCGYYSTLTFLNRSVFPHLERLQSIENDATWASTIQEAANNDKRWVLNLVDGEIADAVTREAAKSLEAYDLILIDDSQTCTQRAATINAVAACRPERPWIVIHDYEMEEYRTAARGFEQRHTFKPYTPQTGLVGNKATSEVKSLRPVLKKHSRKLEPDDLKGWLSAFGKS